jgi:hypothetical protein
MIKETAAKKGSSFLRALNTVMLPPQEKRYMEFREKMGNRRESTVGGHTSTTTTTSTGVSRPTASGTSAADGASGSTGSSIGSGGSTSRPRSFNGRNSDLGKLGDVAFDRADETKAGSPVSSLSVVAEAHSGEQLVYVGSSNDFSSRSYDVMQAHGMAIDLPYIATSESIDSLTLTSTTTVTSPGIGSGTGTYDTSSIMRSDDARGSFLSSTEGSPNILPAAGVVINHLIESIASPTHAAAALPSSFSQIRRRSISGTGFSLPSLTEFTLATDVPLSPQHSNDYDGHGIITGHQNQHPITSPSVTSPLPMPLFSDLPAFQITSRQAALLDSVKIVRGGILHTSYGETLWVELAEGGRSDITGTPGRYYGGTASHGVAGSDTGLIWQPPTLRVFVIGRYAESRITVSEPAAAANTAATIQGEFGRYSSAESDMGGADSSGAIADSVEDMQDSDHGDERKAAANINGSDQISDSDSRTLVAVYEIQSALCRVVSEQQHVKSSSILGSPFRGKGGGGGGGGGGGEGGGAGPTSPTTDSSAGYSSSENTADSPHPGSASDSSSSGYSYGNGNDYSTSEGNKELTGTNSERLFGFEVSFPGSKGKWLSFFCATEEDCGEWMDTIDLVALSD